jgi:ATP-dependent Clp protease ATP-binding subunit ClpA
MRPRFLGTRQHPRIIGGSGATQRYRAARGRARIAGKGVIRIDLASIVSKYIGQTERNLDRLLDEAQQANAVLYFDEADHLFGDEQDEHARARLAAAKQYLRAGARRRRLSFVTGKPRPSADATA